MYGLSFEIVLMNVALVAILVGRRERRVLMLAAAILIIGMVETGSFMEPPPAIPTGTARRRAAEYPAPAGLDSRLLRTDAQRIWRRSACRILGKECPEIRCLTW